MRLFYAINFTQEAQNNLLHLQSELKKTVINGRWAELENLHMTLHFIGEAENNELPFLKEALKSAAKGINPFFIRFTSYGSFRQGKQDLIYVKTKSSGNSLQVISERLKKIERGDMKSFIPHITLVRRAETNYTSLKLLKKKRLTFAPVKVDRLHLMESKKIDRKLVYCSIYSIKLEDKIE